jgi:hypothetical protein
LLIGFPLVVASYKDGPAASMTGGFGEPSCRQCHFDNPLNDPNGALRLTGVPDRYKAGESYRISVDLSRAGMTRGGFEISARFASGDQRGKQAGLWRTLNERVQIIHSETDLGVLFVQHNGSGSVAANPGTNSWTIQWIAPEGPAEPVQFNVAGNATNDDASPLGDYIYLAEARSDP